MSILSLPYGTNPHAGAYSFDVAGNIGAGAGWNYNSINQITSAPAMGRMDGATGMGTTLPAS